jgi:hypothetical protein
MDEETRRSHFAAMNRFLRRESAEYVNAVGTTLRRVWRDGVEYFEQRFADGGIKSEEVTPDLQASFERSAEKTDADLDPEDDRKN